MRVYNYSLVIPEGEERESGYVRLPHGTRYTIRLLNHHYRPCDAGVEVDGRPAGVVRIAAGGRVDLETPPTDRAHGRFTFYAAGTGEAEAAGAGAVAAADRGLVRVVFRPGVPHVDVPPDGFDRPPRAVSSRPDDPANRVTLLVEAAARSTGRRTDVSASAGPDAAPGVTGLSGTSDQRFVDAVPLRHLPDEEVVITVRLVAVSAVRPLPPAPGRANPVPPPV